MRWIAAILIFLSSTAFSQDVHTSQSFALSPVFNPAANGQFDGLYRAGIAYRDQWRTVTVPFRTITFFTDFRIPTHKTQPNAFGAGFYLTADQAGDANLNTTEAGLQLAYHQSLSYEGNVVASVGFGAAYGSKRIDIPRLIFNNQWNGDFFDPSAPSSEPFAGDNTGYFDMQGGLRIFAKTGISNYLFAEAALHHINRPQVSFFGEDSRLGFRPYAGLGARFGLRNTIAIHPRLLFSTEQNAREIVAGANFSVGLDYQTGGDKLIAGLWYRYADAVTVVAGIEYNSMQFLASYDANASKLIRASSGHGAFELSLIYVGKSKKNPLGCPTNF